MKRKDPFFDTHWFGQFHASFHFRNVSISLSYKDIHGHMDKLNFKAKYDHTGQHYIKYHHTGQHDTDYDHTSQHIIKILRIYQFILICHSATYN